MQIEAPQVFMFKEKEYQKAVLEMMTTSKDNASTDLELT